MNAHVKKNDRGSQPASIQDVSRQAGVSVATVSRVIHQNGRFSAETEKRVRKAMEELSYRPNRMAQGLRMQVMPIVGILVPDVLDEHYALMIHTVQQLLIPRGYLLQAFNTRGDGTLAQQCISMMVDHKAFGLIYVPDYINTQVSLCGLPTVFLEHRPLFRPDAPWVQVSMDNDRCGRDAARWLLSLGRKRVLLIGDRMGISSQQEMMAGVCAELEAAGIRPVQTLRGNPQRTTEAIAALEEALSGDNYASPSEAQPKGISGDPSEARPNGRSGDPSEARPNGISGDPSEAWPNGRSGDPSGTQPAGLLPDAILCTTSRLTVGALRVLKDRHISPDQTVVLGIGEHRLHRYGLIDYLAVREPLTEMAEAATRTLLSLHDTSTLSSQTLTFPCTCLK